MKKVAIVTDIRGGDLFLEIDSTLDEIRKINGIDVSVLFIDASDETIIRRFKETRRKHPLDEQSGGSLQTAISEERRILDSLREKADYTIDTTDFTLGQLRESVTSLFLDNPQESMVVKVMSFGFKFGASREADIVLDVRCLPNPYYIPELKHHTGQESCVRDYVMQFEQSKELEKKLRDLFDFLIPLYVSEGKTQLVIAFGCTGGKHRSVTFAERTFEYLTEKGIKAWLSHRDINKVKQ